jgi:16S rRNA pseudouridine516 synthase
VRAVQYLRFVPPRLDELLSRNLGISKTAVVRLIAAGRVTDRAGVPLRDRRGSLPTVGGELIAGRRDEGAAGTSEVTPTDVVAVDGAPIPLFERALILLHKPVGVVTALRDARHPTAHALLREAPLFGELRPVGRLDLDTSGLLLWTTEGALIQRLTHPKRQVPRTYQAALACDFTRPGAEELVLEDGHRPAITHLAPLARAEAHPALRVSTDTRALASITIVGGAYHEVRRIFAALGSHVLGLCRTEFGPHALPTDLDAGAWRLLACPDL